MALKFIRPVVSIAVLALLNMAPTKVLAANQMVAEGVMRIDLERRENIHLDNLQLADTVDLEKFETIKGTYSTLVNENLLIDVEENNF